MPQALRTTSEPQSGSLRVIRHDRQAYADATAEQEMEVQRVLSGEAPPCIIFTEHPPVFTIGTSGSERDILSTVIDGEHIRVFPTGRGGEVTYHGPGQLVCYVIDDLRKERDLHRHVWRLEETVTRTLSHFGLDAGRDRRGIGVWVDGAKIAAVGVRCRRWVTWHGVALNIHPNLRHFSGIVPCGLRHARVTSMQACGVAVERQEVEIVLLAKARCLFGRGA